MFFFRYGCDIQVLTLMHQRGLGNSATQLQRKLAEQHSEAWLRQANHFLADCVGYARAGTSRMVVRPAFDEVPAQSPIPKFRWFQQVYCCDVMTRVEEIKASITSTFGRVLKIDSTKKVILVHFFYFCTETTHLKVYHQDQFYVKSYFLS